MLVTAFSAYNVKFLLFDPVRPDLFAYAFVILSTYFAFRNQILALLFVSAVGVQFREFAIVPFFAYIMMLTFSKNRSLVKKYIPHIIIMIGVSILLPRLVINTEVNAQYISLGFDHLAMIPFNINRDINIAFTLIAYYLPTLMLLSRDRYAALLRCIPKEHRHFLFFYAILVGLLTMYGGTDLARFQTYHFLPQIIILGFIVPYASRWEIFYMILATLLFNKILTEIPVPPAEWYGGHHDQLSPNTAIRFIELCFFITGAIGLRKYLQIKQN